MLADCATIERGPAPDRQMRAAIGRARRTGIFSRQQAFDQAIANLVRATPLPPEIEEWFANEKMAEGTKRSWLKTAKHPAILATVIALGVIAAVTWIKFDEQMHAFPGASVAKKLLTLASTTRPADLEPMRTDAGTLGDLFFMKNRLEHYEVPPQFAQLRTTGIHVFDDEEAGRVAQIALVEKRMQLFFFPAQRDAKKGEPEEFKGWRYLEQEGWTGAVRANKGVLFMATVRGPKKDLSPYLSQ